MLGASATMRMPAEPPTRPMTIHGRRMPSRDAVRSLILPKNGLPTMASRAPTPATSARLFGACSIPTSEFTFNGQGDQQGRDEQQAGAHVRQRVQRDETPSDPACRWAARAPAQQASGPASRFGRIHRTSGCGRYRIGEASFQGDDPARQAPCCASASFSKIWTTSSTERPFVSGRNLNTNPIATTDRTAKDTMTQASPHAFCQAGNASISAKLATQSTAARDRGRPAADRGREDLALDQPAGPADADRERGDEEREADHDHHGLRVCR